MASLICFEFATEEERNEFLLLNDLRLVRGPAPAREVVLDLNGNHVGDIDDTDAADPICRVDILAEYRTVVRSTSWWHSAA
jgi:hypothetical protein